MIVIPFKCAKCGYGLHFDSGAPAECPICKGIFTYIRIGWDEYCQLEITDGVDKS
ncbi:hypothetical protein LCGC14_1644410 [marine sediment metagenome]|uniref:Rubredoxin-like domain-containing protein n=1 Tax=marine sediment metagenome TaxID=412755 RepID=A0A0F9HYN9_9ZZZZ